MFIPQLGGCSDTMDVFAKLQHHHPQPQPCTAQYLQCNTCRKVFETHEDINWHKETPLGREDCLSLNSMLTSSTTGMLPHIYNIIINLNLLLLKTFSVNHVGEYLKRKKTYTGTRKHH
jgi:hypothetical protein